MNALERIKKIGERWFLREPLLFAVYCSHEFEENNAIDVPMRTGKMKVEFASKILDKIANDMLVEYMKIEMFRILLKHPYQRQPSFATKTLLTMASNITIADVYDISREVKKQMDGVEMQFPAGLCFEEYYNLLLQNASSNSGTSRDESLQFCNKSERFFKSKIAGQDRGKSEQQDDESLQGSDRIDLQEQRNSQISELWEENEEACCNINEFIEVAIENNDWGAVTGKLQGLIKANLKVDMDYRKMLSLFKTSVISSRRRLTRMRPNRRFGFNAMGSRHELSTNLLIAIDVSGAVSDKSLQFFFSVINRLFKYGVEKLDVLQFDTKIQGEIKPLKKARKTIKIMGRGGTSFQPVADYYCKHPEYDGLIYFTDGYAPPPVFNTKRPIDVLWVICCRKCYAENAAWIRKIKRNRVTFIPRSE